MLAICMPEHENNYHLIGIDQICNIGAFLSLFYHNDQQTIHYSTYFLATYPVK